MVDDRNGLICSQRISVNFSESFAEHSFLFKIKKELEFSPILESVSIWTKLCQFDKFRPVESIGEDFNTAKFGFELWVLEVWNI